MNVMSSFTVKSLRANRARTIVTIAGVALAAALLVAVLTTFTSLSNYLYRTEAALSGTWMAQAQSPDAETLRSQARAAQDAGIIDESAFFQDVGFGELSAAQQQIFGPLLPVIDIEGDADSLCAIRPSEGRMPTNAQEVVLSSMWKEREHVQLGDVFTIDVGERQCVAAPHGSSELSADAEDAPGEMFEGMVLDSSIGYLDAATDGGAFNEVLVNTEKRTFTVVGFYDRMTYAASFDTGLAAFTSNDAHATGMASVYVAMDGVEDEAQVEDRATQAFPGAEISYHKSMLRYMGIVGDGVIWETFYGLATVLAAVIVVACISLIYNAFAISVAERIGQFALLSSVGATRRQLRRAVLLEACIIALIGIPAGIFIGIGGSAVTFALLGPALVQTLGNADIPFTISIAPWSLALAAILTLVTVLVSVCVPAWRAGRVNVVETLRATRSGRVSKRGMKAAARNTDATRLWSRRGIAGHLFGMGGVLARITGKRGMSKGTTASLSLALAIVLLMTAGSLNTFLGTLVSAADTGDAYDIGISAAAEESDDITISDEVQAYTDTYDALAATSDVSPVGWTLSSTKPVIVSPDMAADFYTDEAFAGPFGAGRMADSSWGGHASLVFLDDATFDAFARDEGLDVQAFHDPEHPRALATRVVYGNNDSLYQVTSVFKQPGTIEVVSGATSGTLATDDFSFRIPEEGEPFVFDPLFFEDGDIVDVPNDTVQLQTEAIEVAALVDDIPPIVGDVGDARIVLPLSALEGLPLGMQTPTFSAGFNVDGAQHTLIAEELQTTGRECLESSGLRTSWFSVNDHLAEAESNHALATVVNVFCLLFTVILALIAMGNVFNTLTNNIILRRREFAVLKSIGLSNRQFSSMIVDECMRFGIRGLIPGMLVSAAVSYLLFFMVTRSLAGMGFTFPWGYAAIAIGMTALAIVLSAAFGMNRCKADSIVEALRCDTI